MAIKQYRVVFTAVSYASTSVVVEVDDKDVDIDGFPPDDPYIEDLALQEVMEGNTDWELGDIEADTIQVGSIRRSWSE